VRVVAMNRDEAAASEIVSIRSENLWGACPGSRGSRNAGHRHEKNERRKAPSRAMLPEEDHTLLLRVAPEDRVTPRPV
jgi:hypothetical protein